ncbi:hypothetical protein M430DRAFT_21132 [Amorphotheca resinae ATCC 22711]|uniref:Uncharacterized protein n=1 Tax=Amorphotheca resinae ATCC 22711 TaxID=857342 RepID=A0A2T3AX19_AMORE|nr:hypothetical protein M430DRAFT_21132 [Amorphotheca resinae ATCC 22711]PSS13222.1 hypothetical protein M430DRAFT_21132 [Amorphotheca resinae ATCC 22711]
MPYALSIPEARHGCFEGKPQNPSSAKPIGDRGGLKEKCMCMVSPLWAHVVVNRRGAEVCPASLLKVSYITHMICLCQFLVLLSLSFAGDKAGKGFSWTSSTRLWSLLCSASASPTRRIVASTDVKSVGCAATSSFQLLDKITQDIPLALPRTQFNIYGVRSFAHHGNIPEGALQPSELRAFEAASCGSRIRPSVAGSPLAVSCQAIPGQKTDGYMHHGLAVARQSHSLPLRRRGKSNKSNRLFCLRRTSFAEGPRHQGINGSKISTRW